MVMSEMFFQSLTNACHAQPPAGEFPAHSQTWLALLLSQAWPWLWAGKLPRGGGTSLVCVQLPALQGRCFWKEQESKLYPTFLWLTICSLAKASTALFSCQVIYPPRQLHLQEPSAGLPCLGPGSSLLGLLVAGEAEATALSLPRFQRPTTAHSSFHRSLFLNGKHKQSIVRNLCDFSPDVNVPA